MTTNIKKARISAGLSQKEVAVNLKVSAPTVSDWESGNINPSSANLKQLASLFNVSADYLLGNDSMTFGTLEPISILFCLYKPLTVQIFSDVTDVPLFMAEKLSVASAPVSGGGPLKRNPLYNELTDIQLKKISDFFEISTAAFRNPTVESLVSWRYSVYNRIIELSPATLPHDALPVHKTHEIPVLGRVAAGLPLYAEENIEGYIWTEHNHGAEYFGLRVCGDSMNAAKIYDGDIAIIQRCEMVEDGDIAVVLIDDEATIKHYHREGEMVILTPQSTNPENQTQIYSLKEHTIRILGRVVESRTMH